MIDEGYIKFNCDWLEEDHVKTEAIQTLQPWRQKLYQKQLVGAYPNGIGFGNISQRTTSIPTQASGCRHKPPQFIITGTQTGNFADLTAKDYAEVLDCQVDKNYLLCKGLTRASSESMSHYAIYQQLSEVQFVFHTHHLGFWQKHLHQLPTTHPDVRYGTPEMAAEIQRLLQLESTLEQRIFLTAGHEEGIFTFGKTAEEAGEVLLRYFQD